MIKTILDWFRPKKKKRFDFSVHRKKFAHDEILKELAHRRQVSINRSNGQKFKTKKHESRQRTSRIN